MSEGLEGGCSLKACTTQEAALRLRVTGKALGTFSQIPTMQPSTLLTVVQPSQQGFQPPVYAPHDWL